MAPNRVLKATKRSGLVKRGFAYTIQVFETGICLQNLAGSVLLSKSVRGYKAFSRLKLQVQQMGY